MSTQKKSHSSNRTYLGVKYIPKNMCNTIHNVPTRAAATKFHPVQYSNFFLLVCLGCSRWAHSLWSKIHNEFYTCNTLLFLLLSIIIIFFFMKFVFVITRHSLLMGGSTAVQKNMTDCRSNSNILKLTSHVMGKIPLCSYQKI